MRSLLEKNFEKTLRSLYSGIIILNDRTVLSESKELDLYLPDLQVAFEINGDLWHSNAAIDYFHGVSAQEYHEEKFIDAARNGVRLYFIWEIEWLLNFGKITETLRSILKGEEPIYHNLFIGPRDGDFTLDDVLDAEDGVSGYVIKWGVLPPVSENERVGLERVERKLMSGQWYFSVKNDIDETLLSLFSKQILVKTSGTFCVNPFYIETLEARERADDTL